MNARLAVLAVGLLVLAAPVHAQRLPYSGSEVFRFGLHKKDLQPAATPDEVLTIPTQSIIIIVGDTFGLPAQLNGPSLRNFIQSGGAILIASDGPSIMWGQTFGITILGERLRADKDDCFGGKETRPFVQPRLRVDGARPSPFDIFDRVEAGGENGVATDNPSAMSYQRLPLYLTKELAGYPDSAHRGDFVPHARTQNVFAVSLQPNAFGPPSMGRMLVMSDQSVFANGMMGFREDPAAEQGYSFENGNWAFSNRTIDWLKGGPAQPRTKCLFVHDGRIIDKFAIEIPQEQKPPPPNIPPDVLINWILHSTNGIVAEAERRDMFNQILLRAKGLPFFVKYFLLFMTVVFVFSAFRWMTRSLRRSERSAALTPAIASGNIPRGGVLKQRTSAQIEVGNLYEAARRRVRTRFDVLNARPGADGGMPPILTANDLADGPMLYQSIRWLWNIGYGDTPVTVAPADWDRVNILLERSVARAKRGDWSFGQEVA